MAGSLGQANLSAAHATPVEKPATLVNETIEGVIDDTATVYIAATVATELQLPVSDAVNQQVEDINKASTASVDGDEALSKPQVVATAGESRRSVLDYTVKEGDSLRDLADRFGLSVASIAWANDLQTSSDLVPNTELRIPPVDGVLHTLNVGDTAASLAVKYSTSAAAIAKYNDFDIVGINPGRQIVIPAGTKPQPVAPAVTRATFRTGFLPTYVGNGYDYGWCTWYAASQVKVPSNWGNANTWDDFAAQSGWRVSRSPRKGAVAQWNRGWAGHVAVVEDVSADGTMIKYSDMNGVAGWGAVGYSDWVPATHFDNYIYR